MRKLFEKKIIFSFYFISIILSSFSQEIDTMMKNEIKFLYIIENDNFLRVLPKKSEHCSSYFITDSANLYKFDHLNSKDQYYYFLNPDCYKIAICWREISDCIIPNIDSSTANIITKGFPLKTICRDDIYIDSKNNYNYYYSKVSHTKFMVFLITVDFFNYLKKGRCPPCQIYKNESKIDEIYMKLLIPLFDEVNESE